MDSMTPPDQATLPWETPLAQPDPPQPTPVSPLIRFGTSTWTYEGWQGQIYQRTYPKTAFRRESLGEYYQYRYKGQPLFSTVGNDSTFYRPPTASQLTNYLRMMPDHVQMCCKVWEEITIPTYAKHARYGVRAGQPNPHFLNAEAFNQLVLQPYRDAQFQAQTGPFLFEFQRNALLTDEFVTRLDTFFSRLPTDFAYAVEIRNASFLGARYRDTLHAHGVAHVYNHWSYMPPLAEQHARMRSFTAPFAVLRLLTPLKMTYAAAKARAEPYTRIVEALPDMRRETVALVTHAAREGRTVHVLVNNRAEGNAPMTVQALVDMIQGGLEGS